MSTTREKWGVGSKIRFAEESQRYTVKAYHYPYAILTKPFNLKQTVLYSIVNLETMWRGPTDMIFNCYDFGTERGVRAAMIDLRKGKIGISRRRGLPVKLAVD